MNVYLLQLVGKWLSLIFISIASLLGGVAYQEEALEVSNVDKNKNLNVINKVLEHETVYEYNSKMPSTIQKVLHEGSDGLAYMDEQETTLKVLKEPVTEVIEVGTGAPGEYVGRVTGYGPDCYGCSKVGNVACHTKNGGKHSLIYDGIYYQDDDFGKVRILAADHTLFPCGTIIKVSKQGLEPYYGVVLDTGYSMREAWRENGVVWLDLAYDSQASARAGNTGGFGIEFSVQRWGF